MAVKIRIIITNPAATPGQGWKVEYKVKGSTGGYTLWNGVFMTNDFNFTIQGYSAGTLVEGRVWADCGELESTKTPWTTTCDCTKAGDGSGGYSVTADGKSCIKLESIPATVTDSGVCLVPSQNGAYTNYGSRIYNTGFITATLFLTFGTGSSFVRYNMITVGQWANAGAFPAAGPMNRSGVWIDMDCDGIKDAVGVGKKTTLVAQYINAGAARTIYVGLGGDNDFTLTVNGVQVVTTISGTTYDGRNEQFKIWHIIPVTIRQGMNYFNFVAIGDGSINDAVAMVGYNNTAEQIRDATNDSQLDIVFDSVDLIGSGYDIATCPDGYAMDTSGGTGNYVCLKSFTDVCNKP